MNDATDIEGLNDDDDDYRRRIRRKSTRMGLCPRLLVFLLICWAAISFHLSKRTTTKTPKVRHKVTGMEPLLISRSPDVNVTADVRGNLGPATVLNQREPGQDWLKDRWQAASDMHGTAIGGAHWVMLSFPSIIVPQKIVLDWETAVSTDYEVQGKLHSTWTSLFDSKRDTSYIVSRHGQSPGVKQKLPLHIVHNVTLSRNFHQPVKDIRILIRSSDHGWGVSLWQVDVYGWAK